MNNSQSVIYRFYKAFQNLDTDTMAKCYHPDVEFCDPVFGKLKGERVMLMWRMLVSRAQDVNLTVTYDDILQNSHAGEAKWEAKYIFGPEKRPIHNIIEAQFKIKNGLIIDHKDSFSLHNWASMAMGNKGFLLGWTPFFKNKLRKEMARRLDKFSQNE